LDNLIEYGGVSRIPLALNTDDPELLERALRIFPGRLLVDSMCGIDKRLVEDIAAKYGAIVF
ncbi:MAG: homocysteine methyltransferase, partial [Oscillospiraceae bacterium]|nr:homocysteine methyltransferase [Oscillospiraceae bacterium]